VSACSPATRKGACRRPLAEQPSSDARSRWLLSEVTAVDRPVGGNKMAKIFADFDVAGFWESSAYALREYVATPLTDERAHHLRGRLCRSRWPHGLRASANGLSVWYTGAAIHRGDGEWNDRDWEASVRKELNSSAMHAPSRTPWHCRTAAESPSACVVQESPAIVQEFHGPVMFLPQIQANIFCGECPASGFAQLER
jgi:hypothetical protein